MASSRSISNATVVNEYQSMLNPEKDLNMREKEILERAFAMPLTNPAYPPGPYRFVNREYLIITYRTDPAKLRAVVPEPLELDGRESLVKYEFIRMPDSNGFGDYTESGQVIPVAFRGRRGSYTHCMFLNDEGPIAGGRELWAFRRSSHSRRYKPRSTRLSEPWITGRFGSRPARWATSIAKLIWRKSRLRSRRQTSCSRSFRTSMAGRAFASLSNTTLSKLF
jgi:acetoacetate decarboxylase